MHRRATTLALLAALIAPSSLRADPPPGGANEATVIAPVAIDAPPVMPGPVERYVLPNGLTVVLQEDHRTARVAIHVAYEVGERDAPPGHQGLPHLVEHAMFEGSGHAAGSAIYQLAQGTNVNAGTGSDRTEYYEDVPSNRLPIALWIESDRMGYLLDRLDEAALTTARRAVLREHAEHVENIVAGRLGRFVDEALYPEGHPYRYVPEYTEDLEAATLAGVRWFFQTWYSPERATLVLVGDFVTADARALIERYFGPIARAATPAVRAAAPIVALERERRIEIRAPTHAEQVALVWPTPAFLQPGDAELDAIARLLARGAQGRLVRDLVTRQHVASQVVAVQESRALGGEFTIRALCAEGHDAPELLRAIDASLASFRAHPPGRSAVAAVVHRLLTDVAFDREGIGSRAARFAGYESLWHAPDGFARDAARYESIDPGVVRTAVSTYLPASRRLVVLVRSNSAAPRAGDLGLAPAAVHDRARALAAARERAP